MGADRARRTAMSEPPTGTPRAELGPIVSSAHLAAGAAPGLSEVEFGLILAGHAFERWMVRCMAAAGVPDLSSIEVLVLHSVRHRDKPKKIADLCLVLGIEDTHVVTYAIKKLEASGLVASKRAGKEQFLVPYFIASHPGSTVQDMIDLAVFLKARGYRPRQVQDFIPAPMDVATCG